MLILQVYDNTLTYNSAQINQERSQGPIPEHIQMDQPSFYLAHKLVTCSRTKSNLSLHSSSWWHRKFWRPLWNFLLNTAFYVIVYATNCDSWFWKSGWCSPKGLTKKEDHTQVYQFAKGFVRNIVPTLVPNFQNRLSST